MEIKSAQGAGWFGFNSNQAKRVSKYYLDSDRKIKKGPGVQEGKPGGGGE